MRLGTRWPAGTTAPAAVPEPVRAAIADAESRAAALEGQYWTLTWLEGLAIATLDDGTRVRQRPGALAPVVEPAEPEDDADDDW
ncbi:hypothetical protein ARHIZOSPH14_31070 [Agromyces rhizosphaerae]|uniref:Fe-S oxidoreductase n=1 Tax=Agromyces rhizosphaerae TaxID=88374 RepID=A0A9W6D095_9MICO|nr:hypothetical protein [Agromyces rhizosphaerae]GLI28865.1 hypothetical protein ARHIZOSPH14_31070 [Agromyces rhizosphaerae]